MGNKVFSFPAFVGETERCAQNLDGKGGGERKEGRNS